MSNHDRTPFEQCALASGLLGEEQLDEARRQVRWSDGDETAADSPPTDAQLANRLVEMGLLNAWQASQLLEGRTKFNLGRYRIIDSIGQGGMGQVFKAEDPMLGRIVAVKVLPRHKTTPEAVANFQNEIQILSNLNHHRLVRAIDQGFDGNVYFLVTEYVPGTDLRKLVRSDGPLSTASAASIIYQVAEGLGYAHEQGLVHRDVKPGNVLVTPEGEAKLSDLGLAGPVEGDVEKDPRFGKIVGTADYLSPDHIRAPWEPTPAWDIYSLGCTLYYAVTGKVPFPGGTTADKARAHCELRPLDPRRLNPELGNDFVDVMADMMAKDPAQRLRSAADVMFRLAPWVRLPSDGPDGSAWRGMPVQPPIRRVPSAARHPREVVIPQAARLADTVSMGLNLVDIDESDESPSFVEPLVEPSPTPFLTPGFVLRRPKFGIWERYWWLWTLVIPLSVVVVVLLLAVVMLVLPGEPTAPLR
ncbi:MAG: serine/threonine-protein kinase [Planctomycetota bacterium]